MSHTKGPWRVAVSDVLHAVDVIDANSVEIAKIYSRRNFEALPDREREANARLIAAAPELLAALKAYVAHTVPKYGTDYDNAMAAIAKATG